MATPEYSTDPEPLMKRCSKCGETKLLEAFYRRARSRDGLMSRCRACVKVEDVARRCVPLPEERAVATRRCSKCKEVKPREAFYADRGKKQKLDSHCKVCRNAGQAAYRVTPNGQATIFRYNKSAAALASTQRYCAKPEWKADRRAYGSLARARKRQLAATFTRRDEAFARDYWQGACAVCGDVAGFWKVIALDHWVPVSSADCPGTVPGNMVPLCHARKGIRGAIPDCNANKHVKDAPAWLLDKLGRRQSSRKLAEIQAFFEAAIAYAVTGEQAERCLA